MRTDREADPAEASYYDITVNTSLIIFQVGESGCGGTSEKTCFLCQGSRGIVDIISFKWGLFPLRIVRVFWILYSFPTDPFRGGIVVFQ